LVAAFFAAVPLAAEDLDLLALLGALVSVAAAAASAIKNLVRSFAAASHAGAGPRPLHVALVLGSRYFSTQPPVQVGERVRVSGDSLTAS